MYRCPLCLKELDAKDKLLRYCQVCNEADLFTFNPANIRSLIKCKKPKCKSHEKIIEGVYLSHKDCKALNPFWKKDKFEIPQDLRGEEITLNFDRIGTKKFIHWENKLLGKISRIGEKTEDEAETEVEDQSPAEVSEETPAEDADEPENEELKGTNTRWMFFPNLLLRATGEIRPNNEKRFGRLVALDGVAGAGKTILALQALNHRGYVRPRTTDKIQTEHFVYSFPIEDLKGERPQPIFEILYLKSLMRDNQPFAEPESTVTKSNNLYTVFIKPTKKAFQKEPPPPAEEPAKALETKPPAESSFSKFLGLALKAYAWLIKFWGEGIKSKSSKEPFWFTLSLYDAAGEDIVVNLDNIEEGQNSVDKIALVIDATDFLKKEEDYNLARTISRLSRLGQNAAKPFCVVLTKMDLFVENFESPDLFLPEEMLNNKRDFYSNQAEIKKFLTEYKQFCEKIEEDSYPHNLVGLLDGLISLDEEKHPIFLLENSNLTDTPNAQVSKMPVSVGLDRFVCWCLEIERGEIIEDR